MRTAWWICIAMPSSCAALTFRLQRLAASPTPNLFASFAPAAVLDDIAAKGYGLTLGIHSRIDDTAEHIVRRLANGNVYVNRNMIGAVVGTQPFGGTGQSGTGPKAGGPNYLRRFATEQTVTVNTTAAGGNASLLAESE